MLWFCAAAVESPEHAVLMCAGFAQLVQQRDVFLTKLRLTRPDIVALESEADAFVVLRKLICEPEVSALLAAFVRRTLDIYSSVELVWPQAYIVQVDTDAEEVDEGDEGVESDVDDS